MEDTSPQAVAEKAAKDPKDAAATAKSLPDSFSRDNDQVDFEGVIYSSSPILDLSQKGLRHLGKFFKIPNLQQLHLQRNLLSEIPQDFFQLLPNLTWLDLRYNKIRVLPPGIGSHKHLKTLLLERNPIKALPVELGQVTTLTALNLRHCPLEFPPYLIVQKGLVSILTFLRICSVENAFPGDESLPGVPTAKSDLLLPLPHKDLSSENGLNVLDQEAAVVKEKGDFFPPMDRLDLSELRKSSSSSEIWPSKEEIRRFWKLRQEIVENEQVEVQENKLLAVELPPNLKAAINAKERKCRKPWPTLRKRSTSFRGILPNLSSTYQNTVHTKRMDDTHKMAFQELQEKERMLEQQRRDKRALQDWREQTQLMRHRREFSKFQPLHRNTMASKIPFATDLTDYEKMPASPFGKVKPRREGIAQKRIEISTSPLAELEDKIRRHTQQIRARSFLGTNPTQDIKTANQDLETTKKLQEELRRLKLEMTLNKDHSFPPFTGNLSLHPPASRPQNIFFNTKY
ncbi:leucine-rich repeat-containing protein 27 isoform X1 [Rattus norvegicus]|uniref:Leucine rich repeat containing 27 n=2 Tax=Rattus norvegicus TaxID=10116 RepID=B0BN00_RAT|nr:leucine-rich repeat-containing protein 27 isoform a [Rattus norvegicus]XP_038943797.1 leucine-rich repeat-containing protein 27 isoform X1 [Rattus norvegicus]AAI58630.1 Lrrc27 protein [Rattus norvegicus]|eukprot:NP_001137228.1 leucine-rich repeat-containing protein 27 isoform a [Rattus norvegicus]